MHLDPGAPAILDDVPDDRNVVLSQGETEVATLAIFDVISIKFVGELGPAFDRRFRQR